MFFVFKPEVLRHESCVYRSALLTGMSEGQQVQGSYALCPQNWTDTTLPVSLPRKKTLLLVLQASMWKNIQVSRSEFMIYIHGG